MGIWIGVLAVLLVFSSMVALDYEDSFMGQVGGFMASLIITAMLTFSITHKVMRG